MEFRDQLAAAKSNAFDLRGARRIRGVHRGGLHGLRRRLGPGTIFSGQPVTEASLVDPANTMTVGEVFGSQIPWTEPEDVNVTQLPTLGVTGGFASPAPDT